jgi:hypothetical protein
MEDTINPTEKQNTQSVLQCWLEEYKSLRSEIEQRQTSIRYLVILNITAIGTILTLVFSKTESFWLLLLVIPVFAGILGMLTFIHSRKISQLAQYIRFVIKPALGSITHNNKILGWENFVRKIEERKNWFFRWFFHTGGISLLSYFLPSILAWGFVAKEAFEKGAGWIVFWCFDFLFIIVVGYCLFNERNYWFKKKLSEI